MKISDVKITEIKPYEKNNKIHDKEAIEAMARSLDLYGWTQPIVVDDQNIILAGHRRFLAAQHQGLKTVPVCKLVGLDEARKKQYRLVDNKLSSAPNWDYGAIEAELIELQEADIDIMEFSLDDFIEKEKTVTASSGGAGGGEKEVGYTIQYTFVFDNETQQSRFYDFMRELKNKYEGETAAARFDQFLDKYWEDNAN